MVWEEKSSEGSRICVEGVIKKSEGVSILRATYARGAACRKTHPTGHKPEHKEVFNLEAFPNTPPGQKMQEDASGNEYWPGTQGWGAAEPAGQMLPAGHGY